MKNKVHVIFHIDMNAFFASVEEIINPELKNKPFAVGGSQSVYNKGVLLTANYEARKYGVRSAMPVFQAKGLCPELVIVSPHMHLYREYSQKFINLLRSYTTTIEQASVDEAYLDMTHYLSIRHPVEVAKEIQQRLLHEIGLPCSIGIAHNRFLAKMASDFKKPLGITVLRRRDVPKLLWPLPIGEMFGIGRKTAPKLEEAGIKTIGDLVKKEHEKAAQSILGNQYDHFVQHANGFGSAAIDVHAHDSYKSIGNSLTYNVPIVDEQTAYLKLDELITQVVVRLHRHHYVAKTFTVQIRYTSFKTHSRSQTIHHLTDDKIEVSEVIYNLFDELWNNGPIRLLGVSASSLEVKSKVKEEINLFNYEQQIIEDEPLIKTISQIKRKFGEEAISKGMKRKGGKK